MVPTGFSVLPLPVVQLSLAAVLKCGQSFRWSIFPLFPPGENTSSPTHEYRLCLRDRVVCLQQSPDALFYRSVFPDPQPSPTQVALREAETLTWLNDYFQLDIDLTKLYEEWSERDPVFRSLKSRFGGIRMLRQDPWENLVSFICSSNNNISRITKMVQSLCTHYSLPLLPLPDPPISTGPPEENERTYHPFPPPSVLSAPDVGSTLRSLGFGYRAEFIQRTAKMLVDTHGSANTPHDTSEASEKWLKALRDLSTAEAREELLKFIGVGRKVADCILLMSLDKKEVIPVDTHVHQIAIKHYGLRSPPGGKANMTPKLYDEVNTKLMAVWGGYAGWAHSVLFTADLKSFSSYGLSVPSPPATVPTKRGRPSHSALPTPPLTPSSSPLKRKYSRKPVVSSGALVVEIDEPKDDETAHEMASLAERVKRRRRAVNVGVEELVVNWK